MANNLLTEKENVELTANEVAAKEASLTRSGDNQSVASTVKPAFIRADWPAPPQVKTLVTLRDGGLSQRRYSSFNMALHVGDDEATVIANREYVSRLISARQRPFWLQQRHTNICLEYSSQDIPPIADSSYTHCPHQPCVVMTADCLPILLTNKQGSWISSVHAGWRGLANEVIENSIAMYPGDKSDLIAWIGPAISQPFFEVGTEVKALFVSVSKGYEAFFVANERGRFQFDFIALAKSVLRHHQVDCYGGNLCTFADAKRFYSYRRDGETGRLASSIWLEDI